MSPCLSRRLPRKRSFFFIIGSLHLIVYCTALPCRDATVIHIAVVFVSQYFRLLECAHAVKYCSHEVPLSELRVFSGSSRPEAPFAVNGAKLTRGPW